MPQKLVPAQTHVVHEAQTPLYVSYPYLDPGPVPVLGFAADAGLGMGAQAQDLMKLHTTALQRYR